MNKINKKRGFTALVLVIYVSALTVIFTYLSGIEFGHFFDEVKAKQYRLMSYYYAYSCIDQAFLTLTSDFLFETDSEIVLADLNCSIDSVKDVNGFKLIKVHGKYKNIIVYRSATARLYDDHLEIISIE